MFKRFWKIVFPESFVNLNVRCTMNILDRSVIFIINARNIVMLFVESLRMKRKRKYYNVYNGHLTYIIYQPPLCSNANVFTN